VFMSNPEKRKNRKPGKSGRERHHPQKRGREIKGKRGQERINPGGKDSDFSFLSNESCKGEGFYLTRLNEEGRIFAGGEEN